MLCREIIAVCSAVYTEHINIFVSLVVYLMRLIGSARWHGWGTALQAGR